MDFSGFLEAVDMMGKTPGTTDEDVVRAFCFGAGIKERHIDATYMTHEQFKRAWIKVRLSTLILARR